MAAAPGSSAPPPPPNNNPDGFLNLRPGTTRVSKIRWTVENDRKLMLIIMGRDIQPNEFQAIANSFPEQPTAKAIQERIAKLRRMQNAERDKLVLAQAPMEVPEGISDEDRAAAAMHALQQNFGYDATVVGAVGRVLRGLGGEQREREVGGDEDGVGGAAASQLQQKPSRMVKLTYPPGAIDAETELPRLDLTTVDPAVVAAALASMKAERRRKRKEELDREVEQTILRNRIANSQVEAEKAEVAEESQALNEAANAGGEQGMQQAKAGKRRRVDSEGEGEGDEGGDEDGAGDVEGDAEGDADLA